MSIHYITLNKNNGQTVVLNLNYVESFGNVVDRLDGTSIPVVTMASGEKHYLTKEGFEKLVKELPIL